MLVYLFMDNRGSDRQGYARQDSVSSDLPVPCFSWSYCDRCSPSPLSSRSQSPLRSPPYRCKRTHSKTPPQFEARQARDHWEPAGQPIHPWIDDYQGRLRHHSGYDQERQPVSPHHYQGQLPQRAFNSYRPSLSLPPLPRQFCGELLRHGYYDVPLRLFGMDARERRMDEHRANANINLRQPEPAYEGAEPYRAADREEQQRWQQHQRQRRTPSPSERGQTLTPSPRQGDTDIGLLVRINMDEADDRGRGRGRPPTSVARGGPNIRRGVRGVSSGGRGRGPAPALLSRMSETTTRPTRTMPALSLSDRMQQD
jgi:hypothetical protein